MKQIIKLEIPWILSPLEILCPYLVILGFFLENKLYVNFSSIDN